MDRMDAARQICQEARIVLSSLRGGPPTVARGSLAQGLYDLRVIVKNTLTHVEEEEQRQLQLQRKQRQQQKGTDITCDLSGQITEQLSSSESSTTNNNRQEEVKEDGAKESGAMRKDDPTTTSTTITTDNAPDATILQKENPKEGPSSVVSSVPSANTQEQGQHKDNKVIANNTVEETDTTTTTISPENTGRLRCESFSTSGSGITGSGGVVVVHKPKDGEYKGNGSDSETKTKATDTTTDATNNTPSTTQHPQPQNQLPFVPIEDAGPYAKPFLAVILDPRAAGPHTLVALRSLYRLLERGALMLSSSPNVSSPTASYNSHTLPTSSSRDNLTGDKGATVAPPPAAFPFTFKIEPFIRGVLDCRFEQTDAGADEAVEMAIADLLRLIVQLDCNPVPTDTDFTLQDGVEKHERTDVTSGISTHSRSAMTIHPNTLMEAFNTVFVTRNTFVHSPALCYHFEEVLNAMVTSIFSVNTGTISTSSDMNTALNDANEASAISQIGAQLILEFLVSQLLHTPLNGVESGGAMNTSFASDTPSVISGYAEANALHDATRVLCLRLIQQCLRTYSWSHCCGIDIVVSEDVGGEDKSTIQEKHPISSAESAPLRPPGQDEILRIVQDNLCLSLLMVGQAIWAHHDPSSVAAPGIISLEVLSEICSTISTLWNLQPLRSLLTAQFESIFTGFYQRALSLLRQLSIPDDSASFHSNMIFDAEVEIILESLSDILCLYGGNDGSSRDLGLVSSSSSDESSNTRRAYKKEGSLETLFVTYDCNKNRSDVASSLIVELSRCCGGNVNEDGIEFRYDDAANRIQSSGGPTHSTSQELDIGNVSSRDNIPNNLRHVPAHLRELCAEALIGTVRSLFIGMDVNDHMNVENDDETITSTETANINSSSETNIETNSHRFVKQQKRLMRQAAHFFNERSTKGIEFLVSSGLLASPVTPSDVASFLRNGIVIGLDKSSVGEYLGAVGKAPIAGKSPPSWERDWFHNDVLKAYCSSFHFVNQTLLDGLRMFLAAFRLPGEAQQIDRILQAFAETCGQQCEESKAGHRIFSDDPKRAADAAYLLSFSIIMLNTDLHNDNIRADRKMTVDAFVRNNTDYGRDITEEGREFPREYLEAIYYSIRDEQIRTEGEGAEGVMTFERWKDVLRGGGSSSTVSLNISSTDSNDLKKLIVETVWQPILSAIGSFWGVTGSGDQSKFHFQNTSDSPRNQSGMLGAQGARLGMDLSNEMLSGLRSLSRTDIFQDFFIRLCKYTGLIGKYRVDAVERTASFVNSVERQSTVIVCIRTAIEYGHFIGSDGWKCVWGIIFELRDLKLLGGGRKNKHRSLIVESDVDLLRPDAKREWEMRLAKDYYEAAGGLGRRNDNSDKLSGGLLSAVGRAFFGSDSTTETSSETDPLNVETDSNIQTSRRPNLIASTEHGKEDLCLWDDLAPSDLEDESDEDIMESFTLESSGTIGYLFEKNLIQEDKKTVQPTFTTGLETYEDTHVYQLSPRARVRKRLLNMCDFSAIVSETRYLHIHSVRQLLSALIDIIQTPTLGQAAIGGNTTDGNVISSPSEYDTIISPASSALAEIILCEIALRNRDRIATIWRDVLKQHYHNRLSNIDGNEQSQMLTDPSIEKCVTGLLRICYHTISRDDINNDVIQSLQLLYPSETVNMPLPQMSKFDRHISEGLWRICRDLNGLRLIDTQSWNVLIGLMNYCAQKGEQLSILSGQQRSGTLPDDDPSLQAFRCIHLILHSNELRGIVPFSIVRSIQSLIEGGERQHCPKLCVAAIDLLLLLHTRQSFVSGTSHNNGSYDENQLKDDKKWFTPWLHIVKAMALATDSAHPGVRQHAIAMLTDILVDRNSPRVPTDEICRILNDICIPMAGKRIMHLLNEMASSLEFHQEETLIELELCISIIFKPFVHHMKGWISNPNEFSTMWMSILDVISHLLTTSSTIKEDQNKETNSKVATMETSNSLLLTTQEFAAEHIRNAVMLLLSNGIIKLMEEDELVACDLEVDINVMTWKTMAKIPFCDKFFSEWREATISKELS